MGSSTPLAGRRIVVTRPREQADDFVRMLESRGADVLLAPMIRVEPLLDAERMNQIVVELDRYDWLVFTSANGARAFLPEAKKRGAIGPDLQICAIGEATAAAVVAEGARVD